MNAITQDQKVSLAILALVADGRALPEAIDAVLGAGTFAKLAGDLYDGIRAKAGK